MRLHPKKKRGKKKKKENNNNNNQDSKLHSIENGSYLTDNKGENISRSDSKSLKNIFSTGVASTPFVNPSQENTK